MQTYNEYLSTLEVDINTPLKMQYNEYMKRFYCPACHLGVDIDDARCNTCGQKLIKYNDESDIS